MAQMFIKAGQEITIQISEDQHCSFPKDLAPSQFFLIQQKISFLVGSINELAKNEFTDGYSVSSQYKAIIQPFPSFPVLTDTDTTIQCYQIRVADKKLYLDIEIEFPESKTLLGGIVIQDWMSA